ncbi:hypothetical protein RA262_28900, partial [Pseudomonas syringae pv. tagetis]
RANHLTDCPGSPALTPPFHYPNRNSWVTTSLSVSGFIAETCVLVCDDDTCFLLAGQSTYHPDFTNV